MNAKSPNLELQQQGISYRERVRETERLVLYNMYDLIFPKS